MAVLCMACSTGDDTVEFASVTELVAHEKGGHANLPKKELPPSPPVTPSATEIKAMEGKGQTVVPATGQTQLIPENPPPIKPLELEYRWTGQCKACNSEPRTILITLEDKQVCVAFCVNCNKELSQQPVVPIAKQIKPIIVITSKKKA